MAATSAKNAWTVGTSINGKTLILHWNGSVWRQQASPSVTGAFQAVAATSARNAWAVGFQATSEGTATSGPPIILRWNGVAWKRVLTHLPSGIGNLRGVAATSPANAWAVGTPSGAPGHTTGIVHWNGHTWTLVPSPNPGGQEHVTWVAATSASNAWAVGETEATRPFEGVISHWNGSSWK